MKNKKDIQNILLDIYEISIALQFYSTDNNLEKLQRHELGILLENKYNHLKKLLLI